ncbi:hypothetical protein Tco_0559347, partial [Tanacetum coccineum]
MWWGGKMAAEPQLLEAAGMVMMAVGDGEAVAGQPWQWCWCRWEAEMRDGVVLSGDCYDGCCGEGGGGRVSSCSSHELSVDLMSAVEWDNALKRAKSSEVRLSFEL